MARFKKGDPKPAKSGRRKGTKNKKKLASVEEFFTEKGLHPLSLLLSYVAKIENPNDAAKIMLELLQYWAPKVKPVEVAMEDTVEDAPAVTSLTAEERLKLIRGASTASNP